MFSEREEAIIKILGRKKMTIKEISEELFTNDPHKPFDAEISVGNSLRRIAEKCLHFNYVWTLHKEREGRQFLWSRVKL